MDKLDFIINQLERLQNDINDIKNALKVINSNQASEIRDLKNNFQNVLDNQVLIIKKIAK